MSPFVVPIAFFVMCGVVCIGLPLARAFARRMDRHSAGATLPPEVAQRLEHMEQAIDSIAVEVERISEGQRFTTKLLSERTGTPPAEPPARHP
ncbi:MAG: hypothetical protein ACREOJ_13605 [Gemmatimonadaceae bacterium]